MRGRTLDHGERNHVCRRQRRTRRRSTKGCCCPRLNGSRRSIGHRSALGHKRSSRFCDARSALRLEADAHRRHLDVCNGPNAARGWSAVACVGLGGCGRYYLGRVFHARATSGHCRSCRPEGPTASASNTSPDWIWATDPSSSSKERPSTGDRNGRARHVARHRISQHDVRRGEFGGLARALHRRVFTELCHFLGRHGRGD